MRKIILAVAIMLSMLTIEASAQILTPVKWSYAAKRVSKTEAVVLIKATIDEGWHVYSQNVKEGGPVKTTFTFIPSKTYSLIGTTSEPTPISRLEKVFGMEVSFFEKSVIFQQRIKLKAVKTVVKGKLEYMTCNDKQCLPPEDVEFSVAVK